MGSTWRCNAPSLPFSIAAEKSGEVRTLFTMKDAIGESDMTVMTARASFIKAHRAAGNRGSCG
jgi:hypothetical protein